jgi:hypothetical protein
MDQGRIAAMANRSPGYSLMHALPRRTRIGLVVSSLPVLILALAGCGASGRLSAEQAAHKLGQYMNPSYRVHCVPATGPFWDYACTITTPPGSKTKPYKMKVTVGPLEILDKAVCGKRSGTALNC